MRLGSRSISHKLLTNQIISKITVRSAKNHLVDGLLQLRLALRDVLLLLFLETRKALGVLLELPFFVRVRLVCQDLLT